MKTIFIFLLILSNCTSCHAQKEMKELDEKSKSFSLAMQSREKADKVLRLFDTILAPKLLYSIDDIHYLVIIKIDQSFSEYYIKMTSNSNISDVRLLHNIERESEFLIRAFDFEKYSTELLFDNRGIISAKKYIVMIDENGNRYGECSVLSLPFVHIDEELNMYCAKRLAEVIYSFDLNWK